MGGVRAVARLDNAIFEHVINDRCHGFFLGMGVAVRFNVYGGSVWVNWYL
ncbi:hypothetical protein A2U01_0110565, partial [Trifolium medium]|nr:hypothetical protein [Trifolium medium]